MTDKNNDIITCPVRTGAKRFKQAPAILTEDTTISYMELDAMVASVVARLEKENVAQGDRIGILAWNSCEYIALLFAIFRLGAIACPVSPRFPAEGVQAILKNLNCTVCLRGKDLCTDAGITPTPFPVERLFKHIQAGPRDRGRAEQRDPTIDLHRPATIVCTSGTTSLPKAALHSFGNHYYSALGSNKNIAVHPGDQWLLSLPLFHVGGLGIVFRMLLGGGAIAVPARKYPMDHSLKTYGITHLSLVATQLYRLLEGQIPKAAIRRLQAVLMGGGPVSPALTEKAVNAGLPIHTTYGLTEMASQVTTTPPETSLKALETSGHVLPHRYLKIKESEILVKGKTLFLGYVTGKDITRPFDSEGWFHTGDLGQVNADGYLTWEGRKDNLFISGGENICPEEVERCLRALPGISQAVVVPVGNPEFGKRPVAFVQTMQNSTFAPTTWTSSLEKHLPRFKIPEAFYPWPEDLMHGRLKPDRRSFVALANTIVKNEK